MAAKELKLMTFAHLGEGWAPCGQLTMTEEGTELLASSFAYGLNYLNRADALEVDPVSLAIRGPQSVKGKLLLPVNNLVNFGGIRDAAPDSWGRRVIEAKLKVPANSLTESQYLLHAGSERVGALDIRASIKDEPTGAIGSVHALAYLMEAAERIEAGGDVPANLEYIFMAGSALGGARPKASVRDDDGSLWLAKFQSQNDAFDIPAVECASLVLAREAGLNVPPVNTRIIGDRRIMMIRRFDRYWLAHGTQPNAATDLMLEPSAGLTERRMGFVSGLTLVGCDETESRTKSYADLAQAVRKYCHTSVIRADNEELFKRMVFNIFASNDDDHLRNHGFIWDPRLAGWRLSPLYDVLPRPSLATERYLHLGIGPQGRIATIDNALGGHEMFSLSLPRACELIGEVWRVVREWKVSFERSNVSADDIAKIAPAFRHLDDISTVDTRKLLP
ncbi:type II toxin-antitoxin system HipA family toxin [Herminiimonas contaminans]|uniref:HipA domain-containing protein n=1 Tax=Herminiimonas contaminans TaxID=1111140 RepID=A0ABS0EYW7_9BURK|nr:HipA domain-containing protein [Herminiimonas contaminans]MBF8179774.1 HipA domain-containing protein [Herminiimonas contaminans]